MTADQFAYWLQGFAELNSAPPSEEQWQAIRDHLALVFNKVTPDYSRFAPAVPYKDGFPYDPNRGVQLLRADCAAISVESGTRTLC